MDFSEIENDECPLEHWFRKAGLWQRWRDLKLTPGERLLVTDYVSQMISHVRDLAWAERHHDPSAFVTTRSLGCLGEAAVSLTTRGQDQLNAFVESYWRRLAAALAETRLGFSFTE